MKKTLCSFTILIIIISAFGCAKKPVYEWQPVGKPAFTPGSMDKISLFVENSVPYIAFDDYTADNRAAVMRFNKSSWDFVGSQGFSEGSAGFITLYVIKNIPYVGYAEVPEDGRHFVFPKTMKFTDGSWTPMNNGEVPASAIGSSLFVNDEGSYMLSLENGLLKLTDGTWQALTTEPFSGAKFDFASLCVSNGIPYVIYSDTGDTKKGIVKKLENKKWTKLGTTDISAGEICATSLCADNGKIYAAFSDKGNSGNACALMYNGSEWEHAGKTGFSNGQAYYTTVCVDNGTPYLSYLDANLKATVLKFNGKKWEDLSANLPVGRMFYLTLFVEKSVPYIAYAESDKDGNNAGATVMKLKTSPGK